ncbi:MAG: type II toxin-antitoxin system VapC family toxin [Thermus sp.]|nr:type II toxin-antitoxin system VapC family toxin [Thermus sp.]MCS6868759.1 type II toxin-antitoxin system VapC family toxin [Thermus sp.]MCS7219517.1 type II toxin-antitoxin system VapC family toxin [Thermus sp.]
MSAITPWEVAVLAQKGRIALALEPRHWSEKALQVEGIRVIPLDVGIVLDGAHMDLPHPDPADRFIAATALRLGAVLITEDANLRRHPRLDTLWE